MKIIFVILILIAFAACRLTQRNRIGKAVQDEAVAIQLEYIGTCASFESNVKGSILVGKYSTPEACLTLDNTLIADYFCTEFRGISIIHIVEIYRNNDNKPLTEYVFSLISNSPFRVKTPALYYREPNCEKSFSICNPDKFVISSCVPNQVAYKKGFIVSSDRIFIFPTTATVDVCSSSTKGCCTYLRDNTDETLCPHIASNVLLTFPKRPHDKEDNKNNHHESNNHQSNHERDRKSVV